MTLSSGESELVGICRGTSTALGLVSIARDLGFSWTLEVATDATAAAGICRRRGLGKIRHLATSDLWIQDRLRSGDFTLVKIPGSENTSDMLTKLVDRATLERHLRTLHLSIEPGRAASAPMLVHS